MEIISGNKNYVVSFTDVSQSLIHLPYLTVYQKTTTEYEKTLVLPWFLLGLLHEGNREGTKVGNLNKTPLVRKTQMAF